jgi:hypothetical protein
MTYCSTVLVKLLVLLRLRKPKPQGVFVGRQRFADNAYTFTKLDSKIIHSSVWCGTPMPTKIVWITLLAMCDQYGRVGASVPGLAKAADVTIEECQAALDCFLAPDPHSRNQKNEGRRIEVIHRGWRVLNYEENREQVDEEHQRRRKAKNQADYMARKKSKMTENGHQRSAMTKTDPKAEVETTSTNAEVVSDSASLSTAESEQLEKWFKGGSDGN